MNIIKLYEKQAILYKQLGALSTDIAKEESKLRKSVSIKKVGGTITLSSQTGVILKLTKNTSDKGGYVIKQNGKLIKSRYNGGINELRLKLAIGEII
jgi:hypothetical protein